MTTSLPSPPSSPGSWQPPAAGPLGPRPSAPALIAYDDLGSGAPVVLLHPSGLGPGALMPFATLVAATRRVVIPHRRGFGASAGLPPPPTLDDHRRDLVSLMDALRLHDPVIVGVSAGATLALDLARGAPGRAGAVVAHEPLVGPLGGPLHARISARIACLLERADEPGETSRFIRELVGVGTWHGLRRDWRLDVERHGAATRHEASLFARFALDEDDLATVAAQRVVVTVGERSPAPRQDLCAALAARGLTTRSVPGSGHLPAVEAPGELAAVLDDLIPAA